MAVPLIEHLPGWPVTRLRNTAGCQQPAFHRCLHCCLQNPTPTPSPQHLRSPHPSPGTSCDETAPLCVALSVNTCPSLPCCSGSCPAPPFPHLAQPGIHRHCSEELSMDACPNLPCCLPRPRPVSPLPSPGTNWPVMRSNGMAGRQEVEVADTSLPVHPCRPPHLSKGLVRERAPAPSGFGALILSLMRC